MLVKYLLRYDREKLGFVFEGSSIDDVGRFEELLSFEVATDLGEEFVSRVGNRVVFYRIPVIPVDYVFLEKEGRGWFFFYPAISCINVREICGIEFGRDKFEVVSDFVAGCINFKMRVGEFYKVVLGANGEDWEIYWSRGHLEKGVCVSESDLLASRVVEGGGVSEEVEVSGFGEGMVSEFQDGKDVWKDKDEGGHIELDLDLPFGGGVRVEYRNGGEEGARNFQNRQQVTEKQRKYLRDLLKSRMGINENLADAFIDRIDRKKASEIIDLLKEGRVDVVKKEILGNMNLADERNEELASSEEVKDVGDIEDGGVGGDGVGYFFEEGV